MSNYLDDYDGSYRKRNPFRTKWGEKLRNFLMIGAVVLVIGGGAFAFAWMTIDVGYQGDISCLFIKCIKIKH